MKKKNADVLKEEFIQAVNSIRPDAIIKYDSTGCMVALPETRDTNYPNVAFFSSVNHNAYAVWDDGWVDHATLDAFVVDFKNRYGKDKEEPDDVHDTSNYHGVKGPYEPINVMEYAHEQYLKRGLGADEALNLAIAIKYLLRVGTKDDKLQEMFKAENFIHRARTEEWIEREH